MSEPKYPDVKVQLCGRGGDAFSLDDALWVLSYAMPDDRLARHYQAWCAGRVLHHFEAGRPGDMRVRDQIEMLQNDNATADERAAAQRPAQAVQEDQLRKMLEEGRFDG